MNGRPLKLQELVKNLLDDLQNIPSDLNLEPLPTRKVVFDCKEGEAKFIGTAKKFGNLKVSEVQLSLEPKETHYESDEEEENLLPIDNSELSTLLQSRSLCFTFSPVLFAKLTIIKYCMRLINTKKYFRFPLLTLYLPLYRINWE
eukprot:sb/3473912/